MNIQARIEKLRAEQTRAFNRNDWPSVQRICARIVKAWADFHARAKAAK